MANCGLTYSPFTHVQLDHHVAVEINAFHGTWQDPPQRPDDQFCLLRDHTHTVIRALTGYLEPLAQFERKALTAWWGTQGYTAPYTLIEPGLQQYYDRCGVYTELPPIPKNVVKLYARALHATSWEEVWRTATIRDTNSGVDGWTSRKAPGLAGECFADALYYPDLYTPVVLGQKCERNKVRTIFMDSLSNYFRSAKIWRPFKLVNDQLPEMKRRSDAAYDAYVMGWFRAHPNYVAIEADAESMDTWIDLLKISALQNMVSSYAQDTTFVGDFERADLLWEVPLITPKGVVTGYHSLFSGLYPTHDVECTWMKACMEDLLTTLAWRRVPKSSDYLMMICGDDVGLLVDRTALSSLPTQEEIASHWEKWGMKALPQKQRIEENAGIFFCKRYYHPRLQRSVYPVSLAINSFVHPRAGDAFTPSGYQAARFCALFDNVGVFHPQYLGAIQLMVREFPWLLKVEPDVNDLVLYNKRADNFRTKVLGETFSLENSPTARVLRSLR